MTHRRRSSRRGWVAAGGAAALLLLAGGRAATYAPGPLFSGGLPLGLGLGLGANNWAPPQELLLPVPSFLLPQPPESSEAADADSALPRRLLPLRRRAGHSPPPLQDDSDAVLLPKSEDLPKLEVLVLADEPASEPGNLICAFQDGTSSPARTLGRLAGPGRHAYLCVMPHPAHMIQPPLKAPLLLPSLTAAAAAVPAGADFPSRPLLNWANRLVFDSAVLEGGDVLVFAKGVTRRQGPSTDVQCVYRDRAEGVVASFPLISSVQQVIRCPPPPMPSSSATRELQVTLQITGQDPVPSLATYRPQQTGLSLSSRNLICACTMVRDASKFIREWVLYHAALGVDQFFLYDNGSEDDLAHQIDQLRSAGIDISAVSWPWPKAQEAGFSHCAAVHQPSCQWMAFVDVDEFIFSPNWKDVKTPSKSLLEAILSVDAQIGQIYLWCYDFGPSGQTAHPQQGVTQGYTCRLRSAEKHKSLVRLDAVAHALQNSIHHFSLKSGFNTTVSRLARINHYKYQAWTEFKLKFRRRVSTYVPDWTYEVNLQSKDRAPGLGTDAIEPDGWPEWFCQVRDTIMQELSTRWFGIGFGGRGSTTAFESKNADGTPTGPVIFNCTQLGSINYYFFISFYMLPEFICSMEGTELMRIHVSWHQVSSLLQPDSKNSHQLIYSMKCDQGQRGEFNATGYLMKHSDDGHTGAVRPGVARFFIFDQQSAVGSCSACHRPAIL